jgi:hypothetical protein
MEEAIIILKEARSKWWDEVARNERIMQKWMDDGYPPDISAITRRKKGNEELKGKIDRLTMAINKLEA